MLCSFKRLIYPKNPECSTGSYMIGLYQVHEKLLDMRGNDIMEVKVAGCCLPSVHGIQFNLSGRWSKNDKHGIQFEMESYQEVVRADQKGITAYLSSGFVKNISLKTAEKIYARFGSQTLDILDHHPERLKDIPGISNKKLQKIYDSYLASCGIRDITAFLAPHGISPNHAFKIYHELGTDAGRIIRENPYKLCDLDGIGFLKADKIAMAMGIAETSASRIDAGLLHTLKEAELKGHLCMEKTHFIEECVKLLHTKAIGSMQAGERAFELLKNEALVLYHDQVYRPPAAYAETSTSSHIKKILSYDPVWYTQDLDREIKLEEEKLGLKLAAEQIRSVKTCLTSRLAVITGGPGTGKTLIQRVLLNIFSRLNPDASIICCAPTGRAARRMEQCTGFPSSTIHKALGLVSGSGEEITEPEMLHADLILVDEASMIDIYLADRLLQAVPCGAQLVLIGDSDQLPSIGPGAVLSELTACGHIPVVRLDKVFRQEEGSRIAVNAERIRHNLSALEYGDNFRFIESHSYVESAEIITELYQSEARREGIDNVALLTPFRSKTETGANALNERLREIINPFSADKPETVHGRHTYRLGDKVMQVKNCNEVNNGDIGYITDISGHEAETAVTVDYGGGRISRYEDAEIDMLELAYASTIHKSQGSEYTSVIINIQNGHHVMLKRPLIYTAVTRAKQRVIIVGEQKALCTAINTADTEKRGTMLADRICAGTQQQTLQNGGLHDNIRKIL